MYLVFFVSCDQSSELLTTDLYFVLNTIFRISFVLFDFEHKQTQGDFLKKRANSEGVFKTCSLKQPFFAQISLNQLQRSNTCSNFFYSFFFSTNYTRKKQIMCWNCILFQILIFSELNFAIEKEPKTEIWSVISLLLRC